MRPFRLGRPASANSTTARAVEAAARPPRGLASPLDAGLRRAMAGGATPFDGLGALAHAAFHSHAPPPLARWAAPPAFPLIGSCQSHCSRLDQCQTLECHTCSMCAHSGMLWYAHGLPCHDSPKLQFCMSWCRTVKHCDHCECQICEIAAQSAAITLAGQPAISLAVFPPYTSSPATIHTAS
ncbi:hypothetical protein AB1Y20_001361 [Prymnesium parvum]|uniref:Uncharacterized protein n=1 Tax=Prymnesium parvum TaxID=97485 RepID=A0AB34K7H2_PRYPA